MLRSNETDRTADVDAAVTGQAHATPPDQGAAHDPKTAGNGLETAGTVSQRPAALDPGDPNPPAPPQTKPATRSDAGFGSFA